MITQPLIDDSAVDWWSSVCFRRFQADTYHMTVIRDEIFAYRDKIRKGLVDGFRKQHSSKPTMKQDNGFLKVLVSSP